MTAKEQSIRSLQRVMASDFDNLKHIVDEAQEFMEAVTDDEDLVYRVVLLASEAVTNAMEHGNGFDASKQVTFDLTAYDGRVEMAVEDEGHGFNPNAVADPLAEDHLMDDGGRGLFLMKQLADEIHLEQQGRCIRMIFRNG